MHKPYHQDIEFDRKQLFNLKRFKRHTDSVWEINNHFHNLCEMVFYEAIAGQVRSDGEQLAIGTGQVLFVPPETVHSFTVEPGPQDYHVLHFQPFCIHHLNPDYRMPEAALVADIEAPDFRFLLSLLHWHEEALHSSPQESLKENTFNLIVNVFFEKILKSEKQWPTKRPNAFSPLIKHLNQQKKFTLSVDQAAAICHLSRSHFMMKFKQTYGITFNRFLLERKIEMAKYLLRNSNKTVTEIAHILEMDNASYFTKVFKSETGCNPKDFKINGVRVIDFLGPG